MVMARPKSFTKKYGPMTASVQNPLQTVTFSEGIFYNFFCSSIKWEQRVELPSKRILIFIKKLYNLHALLDAIHKLCAPID